MEYATTPQPPLVLPSPTALTASRNSIHHHLPANGLGTATTTSHLTSDIAPGLPASSKSSRYYGFVTGGATPAALAADNLVSEWDQNVQVHLPGESVATEVEDAALEMLEELVGLSCGGSSGEGDEGGQAQGNWRHRTFTTGATAGNVLGLACAREWVVARAAERRTGEAVSVAEVGLIGAMRKAGVDGVRVLTSAPHSSLRKACSVVGLGHGAVVDVGREGEGHRVDMGKLERELEREGCVSIICISCSEVNTGSFATAGLDAFKAIRKLADRYGAWVHTDAAFGLMAKVLPNTDEFVAVRQGVAGIELSDSIAGDAHKLLNVPYDAGFFFSHHIETGTQVFQNPGAPYLSTSASSIPSPLNIGLENSRRFRALPVYANLVAYGRQGYEDMIIRQVRFARHVAQYILGSDGYELLPAERKSSQERLSDIYIVVLFRARDGELNDVLIKRINDQGKIYCSGTKWLGQAAVRFAVANWQVDVGRDWPVVKEVLEVALL